MLVVHMDIWKGFGKEEVGTVIEDIIELFVNLDIANM